MRSKRTFFLSMCSAESWWKLLIVVEGLEELPPMKPNSAEGVWATR